MRNEQDEKVEVWFARELQALLGYARWENFFVAMKRAVESCKSQGINVDDHFREVTKMIELGSLIYMVKAVNITAKYYIKQQTLWKRLMTRTWWS